MKKLIPLYILALISAVFSIFISALKIIKLDFNTIRFSPIAQDNIFSRGTELGLMEYVYLTIIAILIAILIIKAVTNFKENNYILFLMAIPPLVLLFSSYFPIENFMEQIILYLFVVSIILYPLTFRLKDLKNTTHNLLVYLLLLIEWDTVITWIHLKTFSLQELNPLINTDNLAIFLLQKLLPFILFLLTYLLIRGNKKYLKTFNKVLIFACVAYGVLFIWQLYVAYLFNTKLSMLLPPSTVSLAYFLYISATGKIIKKKK